MATQSTNAVSTGIPGGALIGRITEVQSSGMTAVLLDDDEGRSPTVTLGDEDVLVGQIGSYVAVCQSGVTLLALVTKMSEQERLAPTLEPASAGNPRMPTAERSIQLLPVGTVSSA